MLFTVIRTAMWADALDAARLMDDLKSKGDDPARDAFLDAVRNMED